MQAWRLGPQSELWQALIQEGAARRAVVLDENEESYLGFVLIRHLRDEQLAARVLALDWMHANDAVGQSRADALRDVGDRCLLIAGLFPDVAQRRRVSGDYYAALGRDAYAGVADSSRAGYAQLFDQLARGFGRLVRVLTAVREGPTATGSQWVHST